MTGTEIYSRLSQMAHERARDEKNALDQLTQRLGGIQLLSDDEEQQLHQAQQACQQDIQTQQRQLKKLNDYRQQHMHLAQAEQGLGSAQKALGDAIEARKGVAARTKKNWMTLHACKWRETIGRLCRRINGSSKR